MPARKDLPSTLQRSPGKAQDTWAKTHDAAVQTYGEGERSHRTAFASLKHSFEKVGDHWEPKGRKGPSDEQAARGRAQNPTKTAGGVDARAPREHLMEVAKELEIRGRSRMSKDELVGAIQRANNRSTAQARSAAQSRGTAQSGGTARARSANGGTQRRGNGAGARSTNGGKAGSSSNANGGRSNGGKASSANARGAKRR